ncbi:MAG: GNAT family N-acetyltransferase [Acidimicrobiia bacterium]|nr:GNAT family N-acetyltransferase [Acidimicrobiia bacterium]
MEIRVAHPDEYELIGAQTVAAYRALPGLEELGRYGDELADVAGRVGPGVVLVAADGDELLGNVTFYERYAEEMPSLAPTLGDVAGFRMLATTPAAQGRGVGRALTEACVARARRAGAPGTALHTTDYMQAAQRLYRRLGFVRWTELDFAIGRANPVSVMGFRLDHEA